MKTLTKLAPAVAAAAMILTVSIVARADETGDDVLLKLLVRKGIVNESEAAAVKAEVARERAKTAKAAPQPAPTSEGAGLLSKLSLRDSVQTMKLYGDLRLRYQYDDKDQQLFVPRDGRDDGSPSGSQRSRWRFRLRLGADFKLTDNWSGGVELSTNRNSDSGNQTYENGFDDYEILISKAFLKWDPSKVLSFTGGKMNNPFYTSDMVWDPDITPNGLAEVIRFHELLAPEEPAETGFAKDGKTVISKNPAPSRPWELSLVAGQFIFDDNSENAFDNDESSDAYVFQTQLLGSYKFGNGMKLTAAPGWLITNAGTLTGLTNENAFNDGPNVSGATRNINLLLFPGDLSFKLGSLKTKFYWDFSYNIESRKRVEDIYNVTFLRNDLGQDSDDDVTDPNDRDKGHSSQDDYAWLVGLKVGENKKKGDWSVLGEWRQIGLGAVDPNLNESDFALSELNTRGFKVGVRYNFTDFAFGNLNYYHAWNLRDNLIGGEVTGGNAIGDSNVIRVLQADVTVEF